MFKILLKLRLKQFAKGAVSSGKKDHASLSGGKIILFSLLMIYIVGVFSVLFYMLSKELSQAFIPAGLEWLLIAMIGFMVFMLCFFGSVFIVQNQLFEAKDNEILFSMPISPMTVLGSRLVTVVIFNYIYEAIVFIPSAVGYFKVVEFNIVKVLIMLIEFIFLPLLAVLLSTVFAWFASYVASKSRWQSMISTVIKIVLLTVYMIVMMQLQKHLLTVISRGDEIAEAFKEYLVPFYYMGDAVAEKNILSLVIFALICIIPTIFAVYFISKNYIKIATSKRGRSKGIYRQKEMKAGSIKSALLKKEFRHYISSSMVMLNSGLGQVLLLVFSIYAFVKRDELSIIGMVLGPEFTGAAICGVFIVCLSTVIITSSSISLEANTLWLLKSLPVSAMDIFGAKIKLHVLTSLPFIIISAGFVYAAFDFTIVGAAMIVMISFVYTVFTAIIGLLLNLKYPKFDWISEAAAVKQGLSPFLALLCAMASAIVPAAMIYFFRESVMMHMDIALLIVFVFYTLLDMGFYVFLDKYGTKILRILNY